MMSAPIGNQNAAKAKQWAAAIERAVERLSNPSIDPDVPVERSPRAKGLDMLADGFVKQRLQEDPMAFYRELGDRLDGKPKQQIEASGPDGGPMQVEKIVRQVVDPAASGDK